ncbi:cation-translocating P-type ATPase [Eggerthella sinensis]|uniref:Haloacid dehalogenase n=1 Tax=Eggerthella sinensis TaxID=242230 RepID=A0A3N0IWV0_9ACTN|nr:cation-translocating P-type ATPase [Eggerthella sinensis]RDB70714.1 haloacid dehalogenase [Eggerthella sinensis]RNM41474.1 haloacid dehalogenase [Eggerthella sinensis]
MTEEVQLQGLSAAEVAERVARGEVNVDAGVHTRSIRQIVRENTLTLFNAINAILAVFVLITGSYKNMLFMVVIVCNTLIGIVQEIRSKRTTDRLSIVASSKASVLRDGALVELPLDELVRDDIIELGRGDQIPADAVVVKGACDVNESLLTGESKLVKKRSDDELMSGSFVNAGTVWARVVHVGAENYAAKISAEAKQHKAVNSEIMNSLNGIIKFVSFIIFPLGALLFARQHFLTGTETNEAILSTVSALVGMIPEGLILLTSTVLAVAVVRLAKSRVLVQQLYCIETLARVDTLCLDKTGTITTGKMEVAAVRPVPGVPQATVDTAFASIARADEDPNETAQAIVEHFAGADAAVLHASRVVPFSSDKKWSGAVFDDGSAYVMGAGQFILGDALAAVADQQNELAADARVLLLAQVDGFDEEGDIVGAPKPLGFIAIHDQIRATAAQTIAYFKEQGVDLKVISGDDPRTVSGIAAKVGVPRAEDYVDATTLVTDDDITAAIERYSVFGRVKPEQKKAFVVALQAKGHIVAMTGDGVNDTLALKQADCSVAMAAGSDAARNVAQLVLVDNDFAAMPKVVAEGRRSINNLQRSASLFLVKTLLSMTLAVVFIFLPWQYPFQPIQMTLISAFTIGLPSFVLALEPNKDRIKGRFLENVIVKSIPGAVCAVLTILIVNAVGYNLLHIDYEHVSTLCVLLTAWIGALLIVRLSVPFTPIRAALLVVVVGGTVLGATLLHSLFGIEPFTFGMTVLFAILALGTAVLFHVLYTTIDAWHAKRLASMV